MNSSDLLPLIVGFQRLRDQRRDNTRVMTRGEGVFVHDTAGREYLEATASFYVAALGYSHPELIAAASEQLARLPFYTSAQQRTTDVSLRLAEKLGEISPVPGARFFFGSSGSEANDFLVKMLGFQAIAQGRPRRRVIIGRHDSYHGGTLAAASLTGSHHREFGLPLPGFLHVSQPDYHGLHEPGETPAAFARRLAAELDATIRGQGPDTVAAFFAEPVSFSAGLMTPPAEYFPAITEVLRAHDVTLVADEVITGFGRTGALFGSETYGLSPRHATMAKGITSGYVPLSALAIGPELHADLALGAEEVGFLAHAATSAAHPVGAAVALKVIEVIERDGLVAHARRMGERLATALHRLAVQHAIGAVRHVGLACALDFLRRDGDDRSAGDDPAGRCRRVYEQALGHGLVTRAAGRSLVIAPPLIITEAEIDELVRRLAAALTAAEAVRPSTGQEVSR